MTFCFLPYPHINTEGEIKWAIWRQFRKSTVLKVQVTRDVCWSTPVVTALGSLQLSWEVKAMLSCTHSYIWTERLSCALVWWLAILLLWRQRQEYCREFESSLRECLHGTEGILWDHRQPCHPYLSAQKGASVRQSVFKIASPWTSSVRKENPQLCSCDNFLVLATSYCGRGQCRKDRACMCQLFSLSLFSLPFLTKLQMSSLALQPPNHISSNYLPKAPARNITNVWIWELISNTWILGAYNQIVVWCTQI